MSTYTPNRELSSSVAKLAEFDGNSTSARIVPPGGTVSFGQLPPLWRDAFIHALSNAGKLDRAVYVVFSYQTPIAWTELYGTRFVWTVPGVKYSVTTSKAQGKVRAGIIERGEEFVTDTL